MCRNVDKHNVKLEPSSASRRKHKILCTGIMDNCAVPRWCWELKTVPWQEQQLLLTLGYLSRNRLIVLITNYITNYIPVSKV